MTAPRILIVDDDQNIVKLVETVLKAKDYDVHQTGDGHQARDMIEKLRPDLILMDIMLGDVSGPDIVAELKKDPDLGAIPVVFLSVVAMREEDVSASGVNVNGIYYPALAKPFTPEELLHEVERIFTGEGS